MLDKLQNAVISDEEKKNKENKKQIYHFDRLKMFFGEDYVVNGISISMPTIGDILEIGEEKFFQSITPFIYNSTSIRLILWENGIDWNTVSDIEVFALLMPTVDHEPLKTIFKDIDMSNFELVKAKPNNEEEQHLALYNQEQDILLYENDYMEIAEYIREIFNMHPKKEKAKGSAKKWIIQEDRMNLEHKREEQEEDENTSTLLPLISACINHPGFKYKLQELKEVGIYQFMDSVRRIQKYESSTAALKGAYSGFVDSSSWDEKVFDFMSDI